MSSSKISLIARWDGWCGTCAGERPLVLTRTGRWSLRAWWAGSDDEERPLTLTCRLCGVGVLVPHEDDDPGPEAVGAYDEVEDGSPTPVPTASGVSGAGTPDGAGAADIEPSPELSTEPSPEPSPELTAARTRVAGALATLVTRGRAEPTRPAAEPVAAEPVAAEPGTPTAPGSTAPWPAPRPPASEHPTVHAPAEEDALRLVSAGLDPSALLVTDTAER